MPGETFRERNSKTGTNKSRISSNKAQPSFVNFHGLVLWLEISSQDYSSVFTTRKDDKSDYNFLQIYVSTMIPDTSKANQTHLAVTSPKS